MTAHVLRHAVTRGGIGPGEVEDVVVGCGLPEGGTGHNIARNVALEAGFGDVVPGMTINRYTPRAEPNFHDCAFDSHPGAR